MMGELIKVARTDQLPVGARKLGSIEDRRIAIFNAILQSSISTLIMSNHMKQLRRTPISYFG